MYLKVVEMPSATFLKFLKKNSSRKLTVCGFSYKRL